MLSNLSKFILFVLMLSSLAHAAEPNVKKVVYALTTGDLERFETRFIGSVISNSEYYQSKLEELDVIAVVHGDAYKFFMKDLNNTAYQYQEDLVNAKPDLSKRLQSLVEHYNVKIWVCGAGVKKRKLSPKAFYPFAKIIKNASIGLIDAQNDGYAFVPLN